VIAVGTLNAALVSAALTNPTLSGFALLVAALTGGNACSGTLDPLCFANITNGAACSGTLVALALIEASIACTATLTPHASTGIPVGPFVASGPFVKVGQTFVAGAFTKVGPTFTAGEFEQ
jgi:hypothetical protein